ncbi:MAG: SPOR domain-containing protein [Candidatus Puniceispirillales bacterium WSBS_2018_MAG_OTU23]
MMIFPIQKNILIGVGGAIALAVIAGGTVILTAPNQDRLVIIKADTTAVKITPNDKGGLKLNSIDSPVMSLLDKDDAKQDGVEVLRPPVTEPELPPIEIAPSEVAKAPEKTPEKPSKTIEAIITATDRDKNAPRFVVQFAAFKSEARAKNTAAVLSTKHDSRLAGVVLGYMKSGAYWRVMTEPMPRSDATSLCSTFRSVGQDCITKLMESP